MKITLIGRHVPPISSRRIARVLLDSLGGTHTPAVHPSLMKNTISCLMAAGSPPVYEPWTRLQCTENIFLMGSHSNLRWLTAWRKKRRIRRLLLGPMMAERLQEIKSHFPHIDGILAASEYHRQRISQDNDWLPPSKIRSWPVGVDTEWWNENGGAKAHTIVYYKRAPTHLLEYTCTLLRNMGRVVKVVTYGSYTQEQFLSLLREAECAVFLSPSETQGIALAECWSCNVPTYVWRPTRGCAPPYSAPLLSPATGVFFYDVEHLSSLFDSNALSITTPRKWVIDNLSLQTQGKELVSHFH